MSVQILIGDCRDVLRTLPDESVHCVVTSPPYWGLRDYGNGASGIGLEPTIDEHMAALVDVFGEVRRVLRSDGTLWVNYGDAYAAGTACDRKTTQSGKHGYWENPVIRHRIEGKADGLKPKDLIGLPWRLAFALQADGWWLRQDIIWHKPNPMPESVTDRCTKAHEYLFLLSKSARYHYDADAIKEPALGINDHDLTGQGCTAPGQTAQSGNRTQAMKMPDGWDAGPGGHGSFHRNGREKGATKRSDKQRGHGRRHAGFNDRWDAMERAEQCAGTRNKRSVWTVGTQAFSEAHFATFPPALIEPCILAGCTEGGTVLDPFGGAGTTALVADRLGRNSILIELNPEYAAMADRRIKGDAGMFARVNEPASAPPFPQQEKLAL